MKPFLLRASAWILLSSVALLAACAPQSTVQTNVRPTIISTTVPPNGGPVVLQGRYFGDGQGGDADESYVLVGANADGSGGVRVEPGIWTSTRIQFVMPDNAKYGYVFVFVDGVPSTPLTLNQP